MKYFLDLDNTVTESRGKISADMKHCLSRFRDVVIVSGAEESQMRAQLDGFPVETMSQNGNVNSLWQRMLTEEEEQDIASHISKYVDKCEHDQLEFRGAQTSFSFVGHHADPERKKAFDPDGSKRRAILAKYPLESSLVEVRIGGTTCLDYFPLGLNKGHNIRKYCELKGWSLRDCLYVGDALFPGGNDETVIGVIPTFPVRSHLETLQFLTC